MLLSLIVFFTVGWVFVFFQSLSLFGGDAGDFLTAICVGGVPHPQGYPLYTLLGRLVYQLPFFTPAWRVSLLSSLPAAGVVALVYFLVWRLSKSALAGLIGAFSLAFSYLFWLYASVPEIFSLNNLFFAVLLVLTVSLIEAKKEDFDQRLYFFSLVAGLSVAHHYFSLWYVAILSFFVYRRTRSFWQRKTSVKSVKLLFFFALGWLPYLYVPLTAKNFPVVSWENAVNLPNFLNVVTRANYGGFVTQSIALSSGIEQRLELFLGGIKLAVQFFSWPGVALAAIGLIYLFRQQRDFFWLFSCLLLGSLLALFYTGFYLVADDIFGLGMYSRFVLSEMVLFGFLLGLGSFYLAKTLGRLVSFNFFPLLILVVLLLMPASLFLKNSSKIWALKNDFTAENFGRDLLSSVDQNGILILEEDTAVFNTWYVRYCLKERTDVKVLPVYPYQKPIIKKHFPDLILPDQDENLKEEMIKLNSSKESFYGNSPTFFATGSAVPVGLLWRYFPPQAQVLSPEEVLKINQQVWRQFHDPLAGVLSKFRPVTLAEVLRYYQQAAKQVGTFLAYHSQLKGAEEFLRLALKYNSQDSEAYLLLGQVLSQSQQCLQAEAAFKLAALLDKNSADPYFYLSENARLCFKNKEKEERFKKIFEEKKLTSERKLEELGK